LLFEESLQRPESYLFNAQGIKIKYTLYRYGIRVRSVPIFIARFNANCYFCYYVSLFHEKEKKKKRESEKKGKRKKKEKNKNITLAVRKIFSRKSLQLIKPTVYVCAIHDTLRYS